MSRPDDKYVEITLDKPRRLVLDLNAMVDFEKATNKSLMDMDKNITATDMRALLWACLRHEEETLSLHDVGKMIHTGNMKELTAVFKELFKKALPDKDKKRKRKTSPLATGSA